MKRRIFLVLALTSTLVLSQVDSLNTPTDSLVELTEATLINRIPVTSEKITKQALEKKNLGQDIPTLLSNATSMVTSSDAGAGIGYSSLRMRGIPQQNINVTLNGVPINDSESQGVFWVNMPDLSSSANSIIIQRGVGTSSSGTAAFGGSISIHQKSPEKKLFVELASSWGSFNTQKYTLKGGTGELLNKKLKVDLRVSHLKSNGYLDRASSNLFSYNINAEFNLNDRTTFSYNNLFGKEKTYQAWYGVDESTFNNNPTFNPAGAIYNDDYSTVLGYYDNQTDNYQQSHHRFTWNQQYNNYWKSATTLHYTKGKGYYEEYKQGESLEDYKIVSDISTSDLVRRKWLDNDFYGLNFQLENQHLGDIKLFVGASANQYKGDHFGRVIWIKEFENQKDEFEYYRNESTKNELTAYAKMLYGVNKFEFFTDIQYRYVNYNTNGVAGGENPSEDFFPFSDTFNFINPKIGFNYFTHKNNVFYFSYGLAHREPTRTDYIENPTQKPNNEVLHDVELGFKKSGKLKLNANAFYMYYLNQLIPTGRVNDVGSPIRENSGKSFRTGIEFDSKYAITKQWLAFANLTLSMHKNIDYVEEVYNDLGELSIINHGNTNIAYSPQVISAFGVEYTPIKSLLLNVSNKYVGKQYLANTQPKNGELDSYFLSDFLIKYSPNWFNTQKLDFSLLVNNIFDKKYASYGYFYQEPYYFPQAGINFLAGFSLQF